MPSLLMYDTDIIVLLNFPKTQYLIMLHGEASMAQSVSH